MTFQWQHPGVGCGGDIGSYHIYYSPQDGAPYYLLAVINDPQQTSYTYMSLDSIAGCYYITAVDTVVDLRLPRVRITPDVVTEVGLRSWEVTMTQGNDTVAVRRGDGSDPHRLEKDVVAGVAQ